MCSKGSFISYCHSSHAHGTDDKAGRTRSGQMPGARSGRHGTSQMITLWHGAGRAHCTGRLLASAVRTAKAFGTGVHALCNPIVRSTHQPRPSPMEMATRRHCPKRSAGTSTLSAVFLPVRGGGDASTSPSVGLAAPNGIAHSNAKSAKPAVPEAAPRRRVRHTVRRNLRPSSLRSPALRVRQLSKLKR